jgi:hypothetical protein
MVRTADKYQRTFFTAKAPTEIAKGDPQMGTQVYRANYREAFQCANQQLEAIFSQYHELQHRKEQLESAVAALGPFLRIARTPAREEVQFAEPIAAEPAHFEEVSQPVMQSSVAEEAYTPQAVEPEPVIAPSYAPVSETNIDPIQARINRALGLAVA